MARTMPTQTSSSRHWNLCARRLQSRAELDSESDFSVTESEITFRQSFVSIESEESFFVSPNCLIESCRRLLSLQLDDTVARIVHDDVTVQIGCNVVPVFALVNGGCDRTLFTFRCVYDDCSAFLDIRKFAGADKLKWVIVGTSHCHDFSAFPSRMPRNTFNAAMIQEFNVMVSKGATCCDIVMKHDVLCSKHVFQNAVRNARAVARMDQARAIRDVANKSKMWSSVIHLNSDNVFVEAFFVNCVLVARRLEVRLFVYDT